MAVVRSVEDDDADGSERMGVMSIMSKKRAQHARRWWSESSK
jgi:hypothetical protein